MTSILGQLLWWIVEHWAQLLGGVGLLILLQWLKKLTEQLGDILTTLRAIDKDIGHMLRVLNEEVHRNTAAIESVHDAVNGVDHTLSDSLQVLYRIEGELTPPAPPYLTPTGHTL
jgi:hypothetical protein